MTWCPHVNPLLPQDLRDPHPGPYQLPEVDYKYRPVIIRRNQSLSQVEEGDHNYQGTTLCPKCDRSLLPWFIIHQMLVLLFQPLVNRTVVGWHLLIFVHGTNMSQLVQRGCSLLPSSITTVLSCVWWFKKCIQRLVQLPPPSSYLDWVCHQPWCTWKQYLVHM